MNGWSEGEEDIWEFPLGYFYQISSNSDVGIGGIWWVVVLITQRSVSDAKAWKSAEILY